MKKDFDLIDIDGDGQIDFEELKVMIHKVGKQLSDEEINQMILETDVDGNGTIDFEEFKMLMGFKMNTPDSEADVTSAFSKFDPDNTGYIRENLLRNIMQNIGEFLDHDELEELIELSKVNKEGLIDYV